MTFLTPPQEVNDLFVGPIRKIRHFAKDSSPEIQPNSHKMFRGVQYRNLDHGCQQGLERNDMMHNHLLFAFG